jgi:CheY-like chemotaxis protein
VLDVAVSVLTRKGMKVLVAEDGRQGVEVFRAHRDIVSLILLDMQMPVMGGEEAMPLLRGIDPNVPIILTSGFDESEITRRVASPKPERFLQKPFTAQRLVATVAAVLQGR